MGVFGLQTLVGRHRDSNPGPLACESGVVTITIRWPPPPKELDNWNLNFKLYLATHSLVRPRGHPLLPLLLPRQSHGVELRVVEPVHGGVRVGPVRGGDRGAVLLGGRPGTRKKTIKISRKLSTETGKNIFKQIKWIVDNIKLGWEFGGNSAFRLTG